MSLSRRRLITTASVAAVAAGCSANEPQPKSPAPAATVTISPYGTHQTGVITPNPPQTFVLISTWDLATVSKSSIGEVLAVLSTSIATLMAGADPLLAGMSVDNLTVTVGVGPKVVRAVDATLPGAQDLPKFSHEDIADADRGGDILIQACANDALVVSLATKSLAAKLGSSWMKRWEQSGFRGANLQETNAARNILGFIDGIVGPKTDAERAQDVWLGNEGKSLQGGTIITLRRFIVDTAKFLGQPVAAQEAVFGRTRSGALPLSGGSATADVDLGAKSADGQYLIPVRAHVRAAHPFTSGSDLMLRRSYSTSDGLIFISFQRKLRSFVATLQAMDEGDALLDYSTATATATFVILPGFTEKAPLGTALWK
jgi:dye decolorizing peroxidase